MSPGTELKSSFSEIVEHIRLLKILLEKEECTASIWTFPKLTNDDIGQHPDSINLNRFYHQEAINKALKHLSNLNNIPNSPGIFGHRIGGILKVFTNSEQEIRQRIARINELKSNFQELVLSLHKSVDVRFKIVKDHLPNISKKAVTRHILVAPPKTKYVNFSWTQRYSGKKYSRDDLVKIIHNAGKRVPPGREPSDWHKLLEIELKSVVNIKHTNEFIQRRPLRISPVANLYVEKEILKPVRVSMISHSPIILLNENTEVKELQNLSSLKDTPKDNGLILIIPRKHIYCKCINK